MANWGTKQDGAGDHRWDLSPGALSMEGTLRPRYRKLTRRQRTPEFQPYSHYPPLPSLTVSCQRGNKHHKRIHTKV